MRLRKIKNIEEKLAEHHQYMIDDPRDRKGNWQQVFKNGNEIFAEFGCGRGQFIMALAEQNPARNYIAVEGRSSVMLRALEKAAKAKLDNIVFVKEYIHDVDEYFDKDELAGIYLNFCDPWPKGSHAPRRLTHSRFLNGYRQILKEGCYIEFKTDNDALFVFAKREFEKSGMQLLGSTEDLHCTEYGAKSVTTEYEDKFKAQGKKINYCMVMVSAHIQQDPDIQMFHSAV
jgi:tRNA (guanine-N7-)-methyltransferase